VSCKGLVPADSQVWEVFTSFRITKPGYFLSSVWIIDWHLGTLFALKSNSTAKWVAGVRTGPAASARHFTNNTGRSSRVALDLEDEMIGHDHNHVPTAPERMDHSRCEPHHRSDLQAARIIRRAQKGDAAAFESIYRMYSRRVYSLCLHMIGNPAEAEDLSQEAFLRVFRKIQTFRGESAFSTWLHRLATNVVLMHLRKKKLPAVSLDETPRSNEEGAPVGSEVGGPDVLLAGLIDRVNLKRAVEQLPTAHKMVFVLHDVHGYKHQEIAEIMDSTVGTSKGRLHRAHARLRDLLRELVGSIPPVSRAGHRSRECMSS